jgi:hypothetical protein
MKEQPENHPKFIRMSCRIKSFGNREALVAVSGMLLALLLLKTSIDQKKATNRRR